MYRVHRVKCVSLFIFAFCSDPAWSTFNCSSSGHFERINHIGISDQPNLTRVAQGGFVCNCMPRAKLFANPLIEGPGTIFGW